MTYETVTVGSYQYSAAFDAPVPVRAHPWAIASGRVVDELTGVAPTVPVTIQVREPGLSVVIGADGTFALVALPWQRFSMFDTGALSLHLTAMASNYLSYAWEAHLLDLRRHVAAPAVAAGATQVTLDSTAGLFSGQTLWFGPAGATEEATRIAALGPGAQQVTLGAPTQFAHALGDVVVADEYATTVLGDVPLRRAPTVLRGRTYRRDDATQTITPLAGATIKLTDFWRSLPALRAMQPGAMTDPNPALRQFALACAPGIYLAHGTGASLQALPLSPVAGTEKNLAAACAAEATALSLSDRVGVSAGRVLWVDTAQGDAAEALSVQSIPAVGSAVEPVSATLSISTHGAHGVDADVQVLQPMAATASATLRDATAPGDRCVLLDGLTGLTTTGWAELGTGVPEYQRVGLLDAVSDADGYFRFSPLHRLAALQLQAKSGVLPPVSLTVQPDYTQSENWIDIVFA